MKNGLIYAGKLFFLYCFVPVSLFLLFLFLIGCGTHFLDISESTSIATIGSNLVLCFFEILLFLPVAILANIFFLVTTPFSFILNSNANYDWSFYKCVVTALPYISLVLLVLRYKLFRSNKLVSVILLQLVLLTSLIVMILMTPILAYC